MPKKITPPLVLLLLYCFCCSSISAIQPKDPGFIMININAPKPSGSQPYWFNIYRTRSEIKIVYSIRKEIYYTLLENDKDYIIHQNTIRSDSIMARWTPRQLDSAVKKLQSVLKKYSVYDKDSLIVKRKTISTFDSVLMQVCKASAEELENKEADRFILDGTLYTFKITSRYGTKIVQAHSPSATSHPLLAELLTETKNIYKANKGKGYVR